jgi:hypothetical protein
MTTTYLARAWGGPLDGSFITSAYEFYLHREPSAAPPGYTETIYQLRLIRWTFGGLSQARSSRVCVIVRHPIEDWVEVVSARAWVVDGDVFTEEADIMGGACVVACLAGYWPREGCDG